MNEASGTSFTDSSGNVNTGTKQGTMVLGVTGQFLNAISLDGTSGFVSTATGTFNLSVLTVAIWFKTTTVTGGKLIGFGNSQTGSSGNYDRQLYMTNAGQIYFGVYPGAVKTVNSTASYNDGLWHHSVGTLSASGLQIYMDGSLISTDATVTTAQNYSGYVRVGYDNISGWTNTPTSFYFKGQLDEAAMWSRALSATEVQQVYRRGANRLKFQVKSCTLGDCSDIASWLGPDNTNATYFSEINNNAIQSTGLGSVLSTSPSMVFLNFPSLTIPTNRFFQYQATFQTDNTTYQPVLETSTVYRGCQSGSTTISVSGPWQLPPGCTSFTATANGGGGASARMGGGTKRAGGAGGTANACSAGAIGSGTGTGGTAGTGFGTGCAGGAGKFGGGGGGATASLFGAGDAGAAGQGGAACALSSGYNGGNANNATSGNAGGGGGGGGCFCLSGVCDANPTSGGGAGGTNTGTTCVAANNGTDGNITIVWP